MELLEEGRVHLELPGGTELAAERAQPFAGAPGRFGVEQVVPHPQGLAQAAGRHSQIVHGVPSSFPDATRRLRENVLPANEIRLQERSVEGGFSLAAIPGGR
jgi:hypothetical protein